MLRVEKGMKVSEFVKQTVIPVASALMLLPFCTDLKLLWLPVIELTDIMA